jgi:hypothetical protein
MEDDDIVSSGTDDEFESNIKVNRTHDGVKLKTYDESFTREKLNTTDIEVIKTNFNYENLILIENLYSRLLKDLENRKNSFENAVLTWFDFVSLNYDVYSLENTFTDKILKRGFKKFFVAEVVLFCLLFMGDVTDEQMFNALKTSFFYLHQNFIIIIFLIISKTNKEILNNNELAKKCKNKIDENSIWINKNTYKTILMNNNKTIFNILKNLLAQIKNNLKDKPNEYKNIAIIENYIRNIKTFKIEIIKDKLFEKVIFH